MVSQPESPISCKKIYIVCILSAVVTAITIVVIIKNLRIRKDLNEDVYNEKARLLVQFLLLNLIQPSILIKHIS